MKCYLHVLTTPTADTPGTTLLLHCENKRYIIGNIAEGTQRACQQMGARLLKTSELFVTGKTEWSNTGGLMGIMLTLADAIASVAADHKISPPKPLKSRDGNSMDSDPDGDTSSQQVDKNRLTIFGPPNLNHTIATARRFIFRKGMPLYINEMKDTPAQKDAEGKWPHTWADANIRVWAMPIKAQRSEPEAISRQNNYESLERNPPPRNPRKRSHEDMNGHERTANGSQEIQQEMQQEIDDRNQQIRKAVVSEMFDSSWRLDALVETPLSQVKLPAAIFVRNEETKQTEKYTGPMPGGPEPVPDITVLVRKPWPGALITSLPPTQPADEAMSYVFRTWPPRGRFRPDKAQELGVPKGRDYSKLAAGESVINNRGETITPEMVLEETRPGNGFAVIDLPSVDYVDPLIWREEWKSHDVMDAVGSIFWILGPGVASSPALRAFMDSMSHIKHVVSSQDVCPNRLSMDSVASSTIRLSQMDPERYPVPIFDNVTVPQLRYSTTNMATDLPHNVIPAQRGLLFNLQPTMELQDHQVIPLLDTQGVLTSTSPQVLTLAKAARDEISKDKARFDDWRQKTPGRDAEIITLGTGSSLPSKYRNVSATLVRVPGYGSYLLDCGENTLGQLERIFRPAELVEILKDLRMIWISHLHADHHLGTVSVIKAWYEVVHNSTPLESPPLPSDFAKGSWSESSLKDSRYLSVISDEGMISWLAEYSQVEDYGYSRLAPLLISGAKPHESQRSVLQWRSALSPLPNVHLPEAAYPALLGLTDIQAVYVRHCALARAVTMAFPDGFKLSYSGDCRPSDHFARIGEDSTVLIHEATFDDYLLGDAVAKRHSTTSEALRVGAKMRARAVVLTHFSQRYQKIPIMETVEDGEAALGSETVGAGFVDEEGDAAGADEQMVENGGAPSVAAPDTARPSDEVNGAPKEAVVKVRSRDMKVCVAFDYMKVKVGDIAQMEKFTPALLELFAEPEKDEAVGKVGSDGNAVEDGEGGEQGAEKKEKKVKRIKSKASRRLSRVRSRSPV